MSTIQKQGYLQLHDEATNHNNGLYLSAKPHNEGGDLTFTGVVASRKVLFTIEGYDDTTKSGSLFIYTEDVLSKTKLYLQPKIIDPENLSEAVFEQTNNPKQLYYTEYGSTIDGNQQLYICADEIGNLRLSAGVNYQDLREVAFSLRNCLWTIVPK